MTPGSHSLLPVRVATSGALLFDPLREALARYARLDFIAGLGMLPAERGGDAGLIGATALLAHN